MVEVVVVINSVDYEVNTVDFFRAMVFSVSELNCCYRSC